VPGGVAGHVGRALLYPRGSGVGTARRYRACAGGRALAHLESACVRPPYACRTVARRYDCRNGSRSPGGACGDVRRVLAVLASIVALLLAPACRAGLRSRDGTPLEPSASSPGVAPIGAHVEYQWTESDGCARPRVVRQLLTVVARDDRTYVLENVRYFEDGSSHVEQRHHSLSTGSLVAVYEGVVDGEGAATRDPPPPGSPPMSAMGAPVQVDDSSAVEMLVTPVGTFRTVHRRAGAALLGVSAKSDSWYAIDGRTPFQLVRSEYKWPWGCTSRREIVGLRWEGGTSRLRTPALDEVKARSKEAEAVKAK